ncbi:MAG: FecR family protein [Pseudomonadota bacterium]
MIRATHTCLVALVLLGLAAPPALAADLAGTVSYALGPSSVERAAPTTALSEGSFIFEGDTLRTGANAIVQIDMVDGARMLLLPDSALTLQDYRRPSRTRDPIARGAGDGKVTLRLLKGGFRARSGDIGKSHVQANYQIIAPVATVGLLGTDYLLRFCNMDCDSTVDMNGLYVGVQEGEIWIQNAGGHVHVKAGDYALVERGDSRAALYSSQPAALDVDDTFRD